MDMNDAFTYTLYDKMLNALINDTPLGESGFFNATNPFPYQNMSIASFKEIIGYFGRKGLIKVIVCEGYGFDDYDLEFIPTVEGLRFRDHGGFVAQEIHLKQTFEKFKLELESLKKSYPERAAVFTGILGDLTTAWQLITGIL